ncbi:MAG: SDR family oxidoreductase [Bacteroidales bacterium]|nr:SDR family oxidoreductase [Bacteroidales bacterium]
MADNFLEKRFEEHYSQPAVKVRHTKPIKIRRVFVTGGASGIGAAIVRSLRLAGNNVAFCDIDAERGEALAKSTGTYFFHLDVRNVGALEAAFDSVVEKWGDVDILVNNVGVSHFTDILADDALEVFDDVLKINLRPVYILCRKMALLRSRQTDVNAYGRVVNLCSTRYLQSESSTEAYSASKGAIFSITHALSISLSKYNITVNSIAPGWIETGDYAALRPEDHDQHPSRRVGKPDDIARIVRFLCDEDNDFINGENIVADGGMTKKMMYFE